MSRHFMTVLERATRIREMIDRELHAPAPNAIRLVRMKTLYLEISSRLRRLTEKRLVSIASAPRFQPRLAFRAV